jgi:hypothetical protein
MTIDRFPQPATGDIHRAIIRSCQVFDLLLHRAISETLIQQELVDCMSGGPIATNLDSTPI